MILILIPSASSFRTPGTYPRSLAPIKAALPPAVPPPPATRTPPPQIHRSKPPQPDSSAREHPELVAMPLEPSSGRVTARGAPQPCAACCLRRPPSRASPAALLAPVSPWNFSSEPHHALKLTPAPIVHQIAYSINSGEPRASRPPPLVASLFPTAISSGEALSLLAIPF